MPSTTMPTRRAQHRQRDRRAPRAARRGGCPSMSQQHDDDQQRRPRAGSCRRCAACRRRARCGRRRGRSARRGGSTPRTVRHPVVDGAHHVERVGAAEHLRHDVDGLAVRRWRWRRRCAGSAPRRTSATSATARTGLVAAACDDRQRELGWRPAAGPTRAQQRLRPCRPAGSRPRRVPVAPLQRLRAGPSSVRPRCGQLGPGRRSTSSVRCCPPQVFTSTTPGTPRSSGATRSCASSSSSAGVRAGGAQGEVEDLARGRR